MNMNWKAVDTLIYFSVPRYRKIDNGDEDNGRGEHVIFFIDPIKVFADMLREDGDKFGSTTVLIDGIKKIRNGEYKFHIKKQRRKHDKKVSDDYMKEIDGMLRRR